MQWLHFGSMNESKVVIPLKPSDAVSQFDLLVFILIIQVKENAQ